jgi:hypothetical protein
VHTTAPPAWSYCPSRSRGRERASRGGEERIAPHRIGVEPGMRRLAVKRSMCRSTPNVPRRRRSACSSIRAPALFDMQLEVCLRVDPLQEPLRFAHAATVDAVVAEAHRRASRGLVDEVLDVRDLQAPGGG